MASDYSQFRKIKVMLYRGHSAPGICFRHKVRYVPGAATLDFMSIAIHLLEIFRLLIPDMMTYRIISSDKDVRVLKLCSNRTRNHFESRGGHDGISQSKNEKIPLEQNGLIASHFQRRFFKEPWLIVLNSVGFNFNRRLEF